jgi:hypothetical protein
MGAVLPQPPFARNSGPSLAQEAKLIRPEVRRMAHVGTLRFVATALWFTISACAAAPAPVAPTPVAIVPIPAEPAATPEFHGARIGRDTLRSRLEAEN